MISNNSCDSCGTLLIPGARFCRQCGKLLSDPSNSSSVTEGTTRVLDAPAPAPPTQYFNANPTGPAYVAPEGASSFVQPSAASASLQPRRGRAVKFLLVGFALVFLFVTIMSFVVVGMLWKWRPAVGPAASAPEIPRPFPPPGVGPPPPNVGPPPGAGVSSMNEFIYPGAETVMNFGQGDGGAVLQLRTADSFDKVFNWYSEKLKPAQVVRPPGGLTGVIRSEKAAAVITAVDGQTNIMLKHDAP